MLKEENLYQIIDKSFSNINVNSTLKENTLKYCLTKKQFNLKPLKRATIILILVLIFNTNIIAAISKIIMYNPTSNTFFSAINNSYILKESLIQETENGYVKINNCTIQDGFVYLEAESNMGTWEEWETSAKLNTSNDTYSLFTDVSGENFKDGTVRWDIIVQGATNITDGKFKLELPFISIPIECEPLAIYTDLEEINQDNANQDIKFMATKQADGDGSIVSLNIFDENNNLLEAVITDNKMMAYDKQGNMYQYTEVDSIKNQYYFDIPVNNIDSVKILGFEQQIVPKKLNKDRLEKACINTNQSIDDYLKLGLNHPVLQPYFEAQQITKLLDVPQKGSTLPINKEFKIDDYTIIITEIKKNEDSTLSIYINKEQINNNKIVWVAYEIEGVDGYTYSNGILTTKDVVNENKIKLSIDELWVLHENEWCIKFN